MGFFIGLFEAYHLWHNPRIVPLLVPDVGYVIWFLAPLVDMVLFGIVGFVLGYLARLTGRRDVFVAAEVGIAVGFVVLMLEWYHLITGPPHFAFDMETLLPLMCAAGSFVLSFALLQLIWDQLSDFMQSEARALLRPLGWGLAVAAVAGLAGIGVFVVRPSFAATAVQATSPPPHAPNIVFITLDTVRADHLSAYGYRRATTPNLERFARTGVLFKNAIAPTSWTLASHASMFTGLLPQQHGADFAVPLSSSPWTLGEILRSKGYETAGFTANRGYMQRGWGIAQGFAWYADDSDSLRHNLERTTLGTDLIQPLYQRFDEFNYFDRENAEQLNQRVFRWLRSRPQEPFFLFINYFDAHDPYVTSAPYNHRFGAVSNKFMRDLFGAMKVSKGSAKFSLKTRNSLPAAYDNCIAYLDNQVGVFLHHLQQSSQLQNTIIIIVGDHGDEFGGHGSYMHGHNLYRGVLHVPLIIAGPGVPKDVRISHIVGIRQLFSTILDLAGGGQTPFSRTSLARFWNPDFKPTPFDDAVVSELSPIADLTGQHAMISLTTPQWQYIEHRSGRQQLYDWRTDPHEQDNLAGLPNKQATMKSLHTRLIRLVSNATGPWRGREYLRALDSGTNGFHRNLLFPQPVQPGNPQNQFRIGMAQAYFKLQASTPVRPSLSRRDLLESLPYH